MKHRASHVCCKSCDGTGTVTYPEILIGDVWQANGIGTCLGCNGHGHFVRLGGESALTHAGPMREGDCDGFMGPEVVADQQT